MCGKQQLYQADTQKQYPVIVKKQLLSATHTFIPISHIVSQYFDSKERTISATHNIHTNQPLSITIFDCKEATAVCSTQQI
jgi:hypothetical protein